MPACRKGQGSLKVLDTGTVLTLKPTPCPGCKVPPVTGYELQRPKSNLPATKKSWVRAVGKGALPVPTPSRSPPGQSAGKGEGAALAESAGTIHGEPRCALRFAH